MVLHLGNGLLCVAASVRLCGRQAKSECELDFHTRKRKTSQQHLVGFQMVSSAFPLLKFELVVQR